jgi:hypothetical protein
MTMLITLNMGGITYNEITYNINKCNFKTNFIFKTCHFFLFKFQTVLMLALSVSSSMSRVVRRQAPLGGFNSGLGGIGLQGSGLGGGWVQWAGPLDSEKILFYALLGLEVPLGPQSALFAKGMHFALKMAYYLISLNFLYSSASGTRFFCLKHCLAWFLYKKGEKIVFFQKKVMFVKVEMCMQSYITNQYIWASIFPTGDDRWFQKIYFLNLHCFYLHAQKGFLGDFFLVLAVKPNRVWVACTLKPYIFVIYRKLSDFVVS